MKTIIPIEVLLVEDNCIDAQMIGRLLQRSKDIDARLDIAGWLSAALTALQNKRYDLILLDLTLRDSQGIDVAVRIIREAPNTPVIVLSSRDDLDIARLALKVGAQSFLVKSSSMRMETLDREIVFALMRQLATNQQKELLLAARQNLSQTGAHLPESSAIEPLLKYIEDSIAQLLTYLARNNPAGYEAAVSILDQGGYGVACREIRSLLDIEASGAKGTFSEAARKALESEPPGEGLQSATEAQQAFAEALLHYDEDIWGQDG